MKLQFSPPKMPAAVNRPFVSAPVAGNACAEADAAQKIRESIVFMQQHLDKPLQVSALASNANISQSHYFALFKRIMGSTPIDYFIHLRMQRACHLLRTTTTSVKCVAAALGYDDPFYFSRLFRSVNGVPPSDYRLQSGRMDILTADFLGASRLDDGSSSGYGFMAAGKAQESASGRRELSM